MAGRARRARFDPGLGHVAAGDRAGDPGRGDAAARAARGGWRRASATGSGPRGEEGALAAFPPAEIEAADLAGLALELALWGARRPRRCRFLTPPHPGALAEAQALLRDAGRAGRRRAASPRTARALAALPLHPRLAHMLALAGPRGGAAGRAAGRARSAARRAGATWRCGWRRCAAPGRIAERRPMDRAALRAHPGRGQAAAPRRRPTAPARAVAGAMAALAYPDRIGLRRTGDAPRYRAVGRQGRGAGRGRPAGGAAADRGDRPRRRPARGADPAGRRRSAEAELRELFADRIALGRHLRMVAARAAAWWRASRSGSARWCWTTGSGATRRAERCRARHAGGRARAGPAPGPTRHAALRARRGAGPRRRRRTCPTCRDAALMETLEDWLLPYLGGRPQRRRLAARSTCRRRCARCSTGTQMQALDRAGPGAFDDAARAPGRPSTTPATRPRSRCACRRCSA